jgi:hypothetical protein
MRPCLVRRYRCLFQLSDSPQSPLEPLEATASPQITNITSLIKGCRLHIFSQEFGRNKFVLYRLYKMTLPMYYEVNLPFVINFRHHNLMPQDAIQL